MESKICNNKYLKSCNNSVWCDYAELQESKTDYINSIIRYDQGGEIYINNYEVRNICDIFTEM